MASSTSSTSSHSSGPVYDHQQITLGKVEWIQPTIRKGRPPTIKNHTVTAHNGYLYCFGGYDGHVNHMSLLVYDIEEQQWMTVLSENEIDREFHYSRSTTDIDRTLNNDLDRRGAGGARAGTRTHHGRLRYKDTRRLRPSTSNHLTTTSNYSTNRPSSSGSQYHSHRYPQQQQQQHQPYSIGNPPAGRNGHTATLATRIINNEEKVCIFIIGGWLGSGPFAANDLHILDITNPPELIWIPPANILRQQQANSRRSSNHDNHANSQENVVGKDRNYNTTSLPRPANNHTNTAATANNTNTTTNSPGPCNMHSADLIPSRNEIYVFRGGNGSEYLNELHALDVNRLTWRLVHTEGEIPQQRANHSSAYLEESCQLFIFGGWNGRERLNDIHILDTNTSTWTRPYIHGSLPHPRAGMSLTALRGKLYLFGGSGTSSKCFHDLHVLDPVEMTWLEVMQDSEQHLMSSSSSSNNIHEESRRAVGLQNDADDDADWRGFETANHHRLNSFMNRDEHLHSFNMVNAANPNEIENEPCISIRGIGPGRRAGHSATAVDRFIYIFGGSCGSDYISDFFVLDTDPAEIPQVTFPTSQQLVGRRLKYLCNKDEFADVVFIVDGQRIYAHKMVLALASDFYAAMFSVSNGFRETSSEYPEIDVPNCSYDAFLCIMEYIYSGNDPNFDSCNIEQVVDILQMADQLLLDHLKQRCEQVLQFHVNETCVEFLLQIAQKTNAIQLLSVCNHFVRNHLTE